MAFLTLRLEILVGDIVMLDVGKRGGWDPCWSTFELKANDSKRLALEEGVHEDEPELCLRGGKVEQQKLYEATLAKDQKEWEPVWQEAILLLMWFKKEVLALRMILEHRLWACTNMVPECSFL